MLLPPNIVVPVSSVTMVCMYRKLLIKALQLAQIQSDRILPQTGILHHADALLSSFPRILADEAACRVLLLLWKADFPKDLHGKTYKEMTVGDTSNVRALQTFRSIVLRLWRAYSSPNSLPDRFSAFESIDEIVRREIHIKTLVGINTGEKMEQLAKRKRVQDRQKEREQAKLTRAASKAAGGKKDETEVTIVGGIVVTDPVTTTPSALIGGASPATEGDAAEDTQPLCTPFRTRELLWTGRNVAYT